MKKIYRLGILGVGEGRSILSATDRSDLWEAGCICDLNEALCQQRMKEHQVERYTTDYADMLADESLDAIAVYTPDPMHADHCIQALQAGKHVICTKPLIQDLSRGKELLDAVTASGKQLMVGMSCRFFETFREQEKRVAADRIGELLSVEAHYHGDKRRGTSGAWGKKNGNNWIYTGLVHPADLVYQYAGEIEEVYGVGQLSPAARGRGLTLPDNFHFVLKSKSGIPATVSGCYGAPHNHADAEGMIGCVLRGSKGCLDAKYPHFHLYEHTDAEGSVALNRESEHSYYFRWGGSMHHAGEFQNYLEHFAVHLDAGTGARPDVRDGLRVVAILTAMEQAMQTGVPQRPDDLLRAQGLEELIGGGK